MFKRQYLQHSVAAVLSVVLLSGCQKYLAKPLDAPSITAAVDRARLAPLSEKREFTIERATHLMAEHSPEIKEARAAYQSALADANVKTPFPNPGIEFGPNFGFGPNVPKGNRLQPFGSIGVTVPTGKRLKRQDEVNRAKADLAGVELQARHRELYLELRAFYTRLAMGQKRIDSRKANVDLAAKSADWGKQMESKGLSTTFDTGLLNLDAVRTNAELLAIESDTQNSAADLAALIGVSAECFKPLPANMLPALNDTAPNIAELKTMMFQNNPSLGRSRAAYEVSERELRLEITKQYPDIHIGPSYEHETADTKSILGLTVGVELPFFDRNQTAITAAKNKREEARVKFEAAANRAIAALEKAHGAFGLALRKWRLLQTTVPLALRNTEFIHKSRDAGLTEIQRVLEVERAQRTAQSEVADAEMETRLAFVELEKAVCTILAPFPGEEASIKPISLGETVPKPKK